MVGAVRADHSLVAAITPIIGSSSNCPNEADWLSAVQVRVAASAVKSVSAMKPVFTRAIATSSQTPARVSSCLRSSTRHSGTVAPYIRLDL